MKTPVTKIWFGLSALTLLITAWQVSVHWERPHEVALAKSASDKEMSGEEAPAIAMDAASWPVGCRTLSGVAMRLKVHF